jgi:hypothetical protein
VVPASFTAASVSDLVADIAAANKTPEADTILLAPGRTFTLAAVNNTADGPTGLPVIAAGEDLTIVGNGAVIERSTAKNTPAFRLLEVAAGGSLTLQNLTLQGGLAQATSHQIGIGGAVYNLGSLTLDGVTVQNNTAHGYSPAKNDYVTDAMGGGVYTIGSLVVTRSTIRNKAAIGGDGPDGDLYSTYPPWGGYGWGGGVYVAGGTVSISNSTIVGNTA